MLFVVPLVTGILLLIPGQTTTALGIEIAAFGLLVGRVFLVLGSAELKDEPRALVVIDRASPRLLVTLALIVGGESALLLLYRGGRRKQLGRRPMSRGEVVRAQSSAATKGDGAARRVSVSAVIGPSQTARTSLRWASPTGHSRDGLRSTAAVSWQTSPEQFAVLLISGNSGFAGLLPT